MNTEDNSDTESSSGEDDHDLAMLPIIGKENAETDMDRDAPDDMNDGLVHHLPRRLLNSTCNPSLVDKGNEQKPVQRTQPPNRKSRKSAARNWKKKHLLAAKFETIGSKCCTGRMERNNQVTY